MMISNLGDGLTVHISCQQVPHHDWMSFLCWYSISRNLPEAKVVVTITRSVSSAYIGNWTRVSRVPFLMHREMSSVEEQNFVLTHPKSNSTNKILTVSPEYVCIRDFDESGISSCVFDEKNFYFLSEIQNLCGSCKDQNPSVFVHYNDGWGKFVISSWINKASSPLISGVNLHTAGMTANEIRLGNLWEDAAKLYQSVLRG